MGMYAQALCLHSASSSHVAFMALMALMALRSENMFLWNIPGGVSVYIH